MKHTRRRKHHHWSGILDVAPVERFDVFEIEQVPLDKGVSDFLIGPRYEQLVVVVCFLGQPCGEVDGYLDVHAVPKRLKKDAQLLGST